MKSRSTRALLLSALLAGGFAAAGAFAAPLRVGTSGDYAPFSLKADPSRPDLEGFDIALARAYAKARRRRIEFVTFHWPDLNRGLLTGQFDLAMSGVTVRPERSAIGRFSVAVVETGAVIVARPKDLFRKIDDLNHQRVRIGVNAGGHLEHVAYAHFPAATLVTIPDNALVLSALMDGAIHAAVTDDLEAPSWVIGKKDLALFGPFTVDRKAILLRAEHAELAADLNSWLLESEADGTLARLREEYFKIPDSPKLAYPLRALLAAIDERLALMPFVATAKRRASLPIVIPTREALVLDAAAESVRDAAERQGVAPPAEDAVRKLFVALMEAGKEVQIAALTDPYFTSLEILPNLKAELRPALLRIGERIAQLLVALPADLDRAQIIEAAKLGLRSAEVSDAAMLTIAEAISELTKPPAPEG
ncbi:MAG: transporter substrate-binding domain-containing protein [Deltaproteobacteria bacterium]|nr:transporter substrate-binding domain-containing protein [Deltaproteobacteria bacterium]MBW2577886.1 transporter substrate-binding domain-containing protein [Deltaproteobacteria bacterium]MBW2693507.1 transporter substrate-binding domain-containing protein [Deltaproteobacteria bacterium]